MPRRRLSALVLGAAALQACGAAAAEPAPTLVLDGLSSPSGLAVWRRPTGEPELLVAEEGRVVALPIGENAGKPVRTVIEELPPGPTRLAATPDGAVLAASDGLLARYEPAPQTSEPAAQVELPGGKPTALVASADHAFTVHSGSLRRSRLVAGRLTESREVRADCLAAAFAPRGYLAALLGPTEGDTALRLALMNPAEPGEQAVEMPVEGLASPTAIAFGGRSSDAVLYAIDADGLCRIDSDLDASGRPRGVAKRLAEIEDPRSLAAATDGAAYVTTGDGRVLSWPPD
ncbi:hypothetical protein [Botrimarina sp.]|uniref:hypothetical protein n=1 Tax=Botrimarina sp. TaxID=2795802 RepID=UPI0032EB257C